MDLIMFYLTSSLEDEPLFYYQRLRDTYYNYSDDNRDGELSYDEKGKLYFDYGDDVRMYFDSLPYQFDKYYFLYSALLRSGIPDKELLETDILITNHINQSIHQVRI